MLESLGSRWRRQKIEKIYERVPFRREKNYTDLSLAGGETKPRSVEKILEYLTPRLTKLYDLGSGRGEVVIQAGFANKGIKSFGIEIMQERHEAAKEALRIARSKEFDMPKNSQVTLINNSFLKVDFFDADVVYVSALAFSDETMQELEKRFMKLRDSSIIIVVHKKLSSRNFELIKEDNDFKMGYGKDDARFYKKRKNTGAEFIIG